MPPHHRRPVLVFGEPGLEKDNIAILIHFSSPQHDRPMVHTKLTSSCCTGLRILHLISCTSLSHQGLEGCPRRQNLLCITSQVNSARLHVETRRQPAQCYVSLAVGAGGLRAPGR